MLERTVKCGFSTFGKTAGRKLSAFYVIPDAVAASTFSGAGVIAAVAVLEVLLFFTFHIESLFLFVFIQPPNDALVSRKV